MLGDNDATALEARLDRKDGDVVALSRLPGALAQTGR